MIKKLLFSIIVPNYNHKPFLNQRLETIFNQTFQDFEVILLDDASTDESIEILKSYANYPKVSHFIINKENTGSPFRQWQKGISLAKGKYIWIAESDDYSEVDFLEKIFDFINSSKKNAGLVYCQSLDVDEYGRPIGNRINYTANFEPNIWRNNFLVPGNYFVENYLKVKNVIPNASAIIFKKSLVNESMFSEELLNMKMCGDWFFWIKLCKKSNLGFVAEPLNFFRHHPKVSRNHTNIEIKILRLVEEAELRRYIKRTYGIDQELEIKKMYEKWVKLFPFKSIFKPAFYAVMHTPFSQITLLRHLYNDRFSRKQTI